MRTYNIIDIKWDTYDEDSHSFLSPEALGLPLKCKLEIPEEEFDGMDYDEIKDIITEHLTEKYGYCLYSYAISGQPID